MLFDYWFFRELLICFYLFNYISNNLYNSLWSTIHMHIGYSWTQLLAPFYFDKVAVAQSRKVPVAGNSCFQKYVYFHNLFCSLYATPDHNLSSTPQCIRLESNAGTNPITALSVFFKKFLGQSLLPISSALCLISLSHLCRSSLENWKLDSLKSMLIVTSCVHVSVVYLFRMVIFCFSQKSYSSTEWDRIATSGWRRTRGFLLQEVRNLRLFYFFKLCFPQIVLQTAIFNRSSLLKFGERFMI